jgi:L-asparaginase II
MDALSVAVRRGGIVEASHRVHAVAVRDGDVREAWGNPELVTHMRSAAKPFQALGLVRDEPALPEEELAIACASHEALPAQLAAVETLLRRAAASEADLECGQEKGSRVRHNCSGKHAGMLLRCRMSGWERRGYRLAGHPLQEQIRAEIAAAAELSEEDIETGVDGCGVVAFAMPLWRMALLFSRLVEGRLPGSESVREAMRARPELIGGPAADDTLVMEALPGAVAKRGAEGVLCVGLPDGTGVALKVEDGANRAVGVATGTLLGIAALERRPVENSRGDEVGEVVLTSAKSPWRGVLRGRPTCG